MFDFLDKHSNLFHVSKTVTEAASEVTCAAVCMEMAESNAWTWSDTKKCICLKLPEKICDKFVKKLGAQTVGKVLHIKQSMVTVIEDCAGKLSLSGINVMSYHRRIASYHCYGIPYFRYYPGIPSL